MDEIPRLVLLGAVVISLAVLVAYVLVLAFAAASTVWQARRPDPLADELDRLLAGITGEARSGSPSARPSGQR